MAFANEIVASVVNDKGLYRDGSYYSSADNRRYNGGDVSKYLTAFQSAVDFAVAGNIPDSVAVAVVVLLPAGKSNIGHRPFAGIFRQAVFYFKSPLAHGT